MKLPRPVRRFYHAIRFAPDRWLQPYRYSRACARRIAAGRPNNVLILCHGNICRSPYAESRLRQALAEHGLAGTLVESAGFIGPGRPANDVARRTARTRSIRLEAHQSRLVDEGMASQAPLILVMTGQQARAAMAAYSLPAARVEILGDLDPCPATQRDIPDPYGQPQDVFERVFDRIDRCLLVLVEIWNR